MRLKDYLTEKDRELADYEVQMVDKKKVWAKDGKKKEYYFVVRGKDAKEVKEKAEKQKPEASFVNAKLMG